LEVTAELGRTTLTVAEFIRLRLGDVIQLDRAVREPIKLLVGGEHKAWVRPGVKGRRPRRAISTHSLEKERCRMSDEKQDDVGPSGQAAEGGDEELKKILGDEYDAVAAKPRCTEAAPNVDIPEGRKSWSSVCEKRSNEMGKLVLWSRRLPKRKTHRAEPLRVRSTANPLWRTRGQGERQDGNIDLLLDVKLPISIELGRTEMLVKEILECGPGTVIELNKLAGEPVDVFVNGRMVAQGEVVVVDEHFGVRVTNLLSPQDRVRSLS